jgi:Dolichyl-phosphate-mannose-protein mannosyltransferase
LIPTGRPDRHVHPAVILAVHVLVFTGLLWWSWRKWPDPLIDFGRELYVPWQITRGRVLYRDIASLFGPLSPYLNALWFKLFGASVMTLAACNLVIFAATVYGIYRLVRIATDRITATAASLATLLLFGFSQYLPVGNFNFVTPYSHEATHGLALSVGLLVCLQLAIATRSRVSHAIAGACFGLVILTKPETSAAAAAGVAAGWIGVSQLGDRDRRDLAWSVPLFVAFAAVPPILFFFYFVAHMQAADALRAVGGAWTSAMNPAIASNQYYLHGMGLDHAARNALRQLLIFVSFLLFIGAAAAVSWTNGKRRLLRVGLLVVGVFLLRDRPLALALPLITLTVLVTAVLVFRHLRTDRDDAIRLLSLIMWSTFALVLLAKMGLSARLVHYGFYLALPATVAAIVLTCWLTPRLLDAWSGGRAGRGFRQIALWMLVAAIGPYVGLSQGWYRTKVLPVSSGADRFFASTAPGYWQGAAVRDVLQHLQRIDGATATLAVLPEGVMLNFLLRRDSPLRVVNLMPPELLAFGEEDVLQSLQTAPPDFVLLVHKDTSEYGYPLFGTDRRYGLRILTWVRAHYRSRHVVGRDPLSESGFGIEILERRSGP